MAKLKLHLRLTADDITDENRAEALRLRPDDRLHLDELKIYDRIAPLLAAHDYLNDLFIDSLVEYCRVVCRINELCGFLRTKGDTYESITRNGYQLKSRPEVGQLNELRRIMRGYVTDFGLSPQAKQALEKAVQLDLFDENEQENEFTSAEHNYSQHAAPVRH